MKMNLKKWFCFFAAFALMTTGMLAFAETESEPVVQPIEQAETIEEELRSPTEEELAELEFETEELEAETSQDEPGETEYEDTKYLDALTAYNKARLENSLNALKEELDQMVVNAQLTREQADLIFSRAQEQMDIDSSFIENGRGNAKGWMYSRSNRKNSMSNRWSSSYGSRRW